MSDKLENQPTIERENTSAIYACTTIQIQDERLEPLYHVIIDQILNGTRPHEFQYIEGIHIHGSDLTTQEKTTALQIAQKIFEKKGVKFDSCYIDILGKDSLNFGLYFRDEQQLQQLNHTLNESVHFSFISDLLPNGKYKPRGEKEGQNPGHDKKEPHLKNGKVIID